MDWNKISEWIGRASVASLMAVILVAGQMGYWVWGEQYKDMKADRDQWKTLALKATKLADEAVPAIKPIGMQPPAPITGDVTPDVVENKISEIQMRVDK